MKRSEERLRKTISTNREIEPIIVATKYRGKGCGSQLLERAIQEAQKNGVRVLSVKTVARNEKTIRFLNSRGFNNIGSVELFMDFSDRVWKSGVKLHDRDFKF